MDEQSLCRNPINFRCWISYRIYNSCKLSRGGGEADWTPWLLPWAIRCCWGWVHFLVGFANIDLQTIFRFEVAVTLVTLESTGFVLLKIFFEAKAEVSCPETLPSSWHFFLEFILWHCRSAISLGVQGKCEWGANIEGEALSQADDLRRYLKIHTGEK